MLASFNVRRTYCKLALSIHVDCERREASASVTYDRHLVLSGHALPFEAVSTPEKAEAWTRQDMGERGTLMEAWEHQYRTGVPA